MRRDGFQVRQAAYGVYHPDYDAHVYRNLNFNKIDAEPINRGHDDESIQYGNFTYEHVTLENCRVGRDPLIQLTCTAPTAGFSGHFRNLVLNNNVARQGKVVDLGGGPRNDKLQNPVPYYFHDFFGSGRVTKVVNAKFLEQMPEDNYHTIENFTGKDVRAADVAGVTFPQLLDPIDDLPPVTMITSVRRNKDKLIVRGLSHDNGEVASVLVNGQAATIFESHAGVADWEFVFAPHGENVTKVVAKAVDQAGNAERVGHRLSLPR